MSERLRLECPCGRAHVLDVTPDAGDPRGEIVPLADGWGPIGGATLARWANEGRLRAHRLERRKLAAWESDIRAAIEADPASPRSTTPAPITNRRLAALLSDPNMEAHAAE